MSSIYDTPHIGGKNWLSKDQLEVQLNKGMKGLNLSNLPLRTRSKVVKQAVCRSLGYIPPETFRKTKPRFPAQGLDVYTQKSNNLQIWNEEIVPDRRYALVRVDENSVVTYVRVVTGRYLEVLDTTGTLTRKYQAKYPSEVVQSCLLSEDVQQLERWIAPGMTKATSTSPVQPPEVGKVMSIRAVYDALLRIAGKTVSDRGADQERLRGAILHREVCRALGYEAYEDTGGFPDVLNQLVEVKLQTSPTIDLGLILPSSSDLITGIETLGIRHSDVRYAIFYGGVVPRGVQIHHLLLCRGASFFQHFNQFGGLVQNLKLQIPLPKDFFE